MAHRPEMVEISDMKLGKKILLVAIAFYVLKGIVIVAVLIWALMF